MNTAQTIQKLLTESDVTAATLYGGYAMLRSGERLQFEAGKQVKIKRNRDGRCTFLVQEYADGSRLRMTWTDHSGYRYTDASTQEVVA